MIDQRAKLEQVARAWVDVNGLGHYPYRDEMIGSLVNLLASREAAVLEEAANLVEVLELGSPSGLSRKEQLRIYDILAKVEKMIRDLAQERRV